MNKGSVLRVVVAACLVATMSTPAWAAGSGADGTRDEQAAASGELAAVAADSSGEEVADVAGEEPAETGSSDAEIAQAAETEEAAEVSEPEEDEIALLENGEEEAVEPVAVYRLYQPANSEHLYTTDLNEVNTLYRSCGWGYEGVSWNAPSEGVPVYRLYNPGLGSHLYTSSKNEIKVLTSTEGWQYDNDGKPLFYSGGEVGVYRLYSSPLGGLHLLTTSANEYSVLAGYGWAQEGMTSSALSLPELTFAQTRYYPQVMTDGLMSSAQGGVRYYKDGAVQTGWISETAADGGTNRYYADASGAVAKGLFSVDGTLYYAKQSYAIAADEYVIDGSTLYYAESSGAIRATSDLEVRTSQIAGECGYDLYNCFMWCANRTFTVIDDAERDLYGTDWVEDEATRLLFEECGDCYSITAGFYCLAKYLGYDAYAIAGYVESSDGSSVPNATGLYSSHSWVEIHRGGTTYLYDAEAQQEMPGYLWFGCTYETSAIVYYFREELYG